MPRPKPSEPFVRKSTSAPQSIWDMIDDYGIDRKVRSQSEALRRIIVAGLIAEGYTVRETPREAASRDPADSLDRGDEP